MSLTLRRRAGRRFAVAVVGTALAAAGLSACAQLPSTAATVGDTTISMDDLERETQDSLEDPAVGEALTAYGESTIRTFVLNQLVQLELAKQIAEDKGISIDEDEALATYLADTTVEDLQAQQGLSKDMIERDAIIKQVVAELGKDAAGQTADEIQAGIESSIKAEYAADPLLAKDWQLSLLPTESLEQATEWLAQINAGEVTLEQLGATVPPDPSTGNFYPVQLPWNVRDGQRNPELETQIEAIPVGEVGMITQSGPDPTNPQAVITQALLARVDSVTTAGDEEIAAQAAQQAQQQFAEAGDSAAAEAAADIDIEINPRLGKTERPELGLPGVAAPAPDTFSEPASSSAPAVPGMGG